LANDPCGPPRDPLPVPPAPIGRPGELLADAYEKLGWYWWPTEQSITTAAYNGRPACDNRGWCTFGCPQKSLSTVDVTYWPPALEKGVELRTGARVREVLLDATGKAVGGWQGTWGGTVSTRQFYETDPSRDYVRGFIISGCRGWSPLNLALQVAPWGSGHHDALDERINHEIVMYLCGEDLPEEANRVELDWEHQDRFGLPGVRTHYALGDNSRRLGTDMIAHGHQVLDAAGA